MALAAHDTTPAPPPKVELQLCDVATDPVVLLAIEKATELSSAAVFGSVQAVAELCKTPRAAMFLDQGVGKWATTALMSAAQAGRADVAAVLLDAGAEVDSCDLLGRTPLMFAAANGEAAMLGPLLARGASQSVRADNGWTALMFACALGQYDAAGALLEAALGEDQALHQTRTVLLSVQSALGLAHEYDMPEIVALLSHLLAQEDALDVGAALLKAQDVWRDGGRRQRQSMETDAPLPNKRNQVAERIEVEARVAASIEVGVQD